MTEFLGLPPPFLLLLPLALAAGVDIFLTLLVVIAWLDPGLGGLPGVGEHPLRWAILAALAFLYLLEGGMEIRPLGGLIWHNLQLVLRPFGGALLALTLLDGLPIYLVLCGTLMTAVVAAFFHVLSWGEKLSQFLSPGRRVSALTHSLAEDTLVLALLVLAIERPFGAFLLSGALLVAGLLAGGSLHHLTRLGIALLWDRVWGMVSPTRWRETTELPRWIRRWSRTEGFLGIHGLRGGAKGLPRTSAFRAGWILESGDARFFAFRTKWAPVFLSLDGYRMFPAEPSSIASRVPLEASDGSKSALFLQRGGPVPKSHKSRQNL